MFHGIRNKRIPVLCRGRGPRTPAVLGFCALSVRFPPRRAGGLLALCALRSRRAQGPVAALPPPLRPGSLRAVARLPPPALPLGGGGWGSLPSVSPAPGGRFRRSRRRRVGGSLRSLLAFCGGALCLFLFLSPLRLFVPPGAVSRRGRVAPLASLSARPPVPCRVSLRLCGFLARLPLAGSPRLGGGACRRCVAAAVSARFPAGLRFRSRLRRRRSRSVAVGRRGAWRLFFPLLAWSLRRVGAFPFPRHRLPGGGRVFWWPPAVAGIPPISGERCRFRARRWPLRRGRLCRWRGCVRSRRCAGCCGFLGVGVRFRAFRLCSAFGRVGSCRRCRRPRFRVGGFPFRALSRWPASLSLARRLLLWPRFRLLGVCRLCGGFGVAGCGFSVRFLGAAAVGRLAACRRFWRLGVRFSLGGFLVFGLLCRRCRRSRCWSPVSPAVAGAGSSAARAAPWPCAAPPPLLAAFLCRRARLFGLPPGRTGRLVLLPVARVAPLPLSLRLANSRTGVAGFTASSFSPWRFLALARLSPMRFFFSPGRAI